MLIVSVQRTNELDCAETDERGDGDAISPFGLPQLPRLRHKKRRIDDKCETEDRGNNRLHVAPLKHAPNTAAPLQHHAVMVGGRSKAPKGRASQVSAAHHSEVAGKTVAKYGHLPRLKPFAAKQSGPVTSR